jgi:exopolysaccharide biosynthesis protein
MKNYLKTNMKKIAQLFFLSFIIAILINLIQFKPVTGQTQITNLNVNIEQNLPQNILAQGHQINLNNRTYAASWLQWRENDTIHTGISDVSASNIFGLDLLTTNDFSSQQVQWYSFNEKLPVKFIAPNRYLDITTFIPIAGLNLEINNDILEFTTPIIEINNINITEESWGKKIEIDITRPTFWQSGQVNNQGIIKIEAIANPILLEKFAPKIEEEKPETEQADDVEIEPEPVELPLLTLENKEQNQTIFNLNLPDTKRIKIVTIGNKLILELRDDVLVAKNINWYPGLTWRQNYVTISNKITKEKNSFPVTYLEIDNKSSLDLEPITTNKNEMIGINPLVTTARKANVIAAINAGFFNRNNQLPLGAIKSNNSWLSGPILNRGAIAWNAQKQYKFGRLTLEEILTINNGEKLPIILLNTGYVKAGIARYTNHWGENYTTLTENENVVVVEDNIIQNQLTNLSAGKETITIPKNGYLLVLRSFSSALPKLLIGAKVELKSNTTPAEFNNYPHIIGGGPLLIENSKIVLNGEAEGFSKNFISGTASRSAIAETKNGNIIIVAAHNRIGGKGPSLQEMAEIMLKLGAKNALNLDGGSSTSLYLGGQLIDRSPLSAARVHNGIGIKIQ